MPKTIEQIFEETSVKFRAQMIDAVENALESVYKDYLPHVENDTYFNVKQQAREYVIHFMQDSLEEHDRVMFENELFVPYKSKHLRAKIFKDNKEEIVALIGQDIVDRVKDLENRMVGDWEVKYV